MATILAILAGLKGAGGIIAGIGAFSGLALPFSPFLRKHWLAIAVAALALIAIGLLYAWHVSKVHEARVAERQICTMEKKQSREDADEIDRSANEQALNDHLAELEAERIRTLAAVAQTQEYQDEIAALPAQIRVCRAATAADDRRMQRH